MDSDEEWNLDDDEEVVMPRELPKGCRSFCIYCILTWFELYWCVLMYLKTIFKNNFYYLLFTNLILSKMCNTLLVD